MALCPNDICIQPQAFALANQIEFGAVRLLERSVQIAQQRQSPNVVPQDVRAAFEAMLVEIAAALQSAGNGTFTEVELTEDDFKRLTKLPFTVPDIANEDDDDL
jgi:hypothetical protein